MKTRIIIPMLALAVAVTTFSCGRAPRPGPEIYWPPAPRAAVIKYAGSFQGSRDLRRGFIGKVKDFLFGRKSGWDMGKPYGVAVDYKSKLYIVDTAHKGVLIYNRTSGSAKFINSLGRLGTLLEPVYLVLDPAGNIYVSDTRLQRVVVFTADGTFSHFIGSDTLFAAPVGMAFDHQSKHLYVVDTRKHDVKVFDRNGRLVSIIGRKGDEQGEFHYPVTVAVNSGDTVYVVDAFHFAVQAFDSAGQFLFSFGHSRTGIGELARPRDIAIDSRGLLYVTDAMRNNVQMYRGDGEFLLSFGEIGTGPGEFQLPAGICISDSDTVYVVDSINRRIQMFVLAAAAGSERSKNE
ncbi:MAG: 6-bladed beta-propeller [Candidatus Kerfeldbacteria bacterium]|nr:6-bladed beta-propeller [Candidatus Kerfeldbacteria bacterium]